VPPAAPVPPARPVAPTGEAGPAADGPAERAGETTAAEADRTDQGSGHTAGYRIEDLSRLSGTTVRTIRAYTDRGLLPRPERSGRANVYGPEHLARLRQIAGLLDRGYTLASIKELLAAWDAGTGLGGVLGLVEEVDRPWSDEQPARITLDELTAAFGGSTEADAVREALRLGVLVAVDGSPDEFVVPSPQELAVAVELHAAGVPLPAITGHLRELRTQVEHISERFLEFTAEHVFQRFLGHPPTDQEAAQAADLVRRLRPLAQQTVDAELARAMRARASEHIRRHLAHPAAPAARIDWVDPAGRPAVMLAHEPPVPDAEPAAQGTAAAPAVDTEPAAESSGITTPAPPGTVRLPAATLAAVRALVGAEHTAAFVAAATDREVAARRMDALTALHDHPS
jgi:DNA-binding transcriptional MerR regulator